MWKIKIITKPGPIENEIKNLAGVDLQIVLNLELYLSKEKTEGKDCTKAYSAAIVVLISLTQPCYCSSRSWLGSMQYASELPTKGLCSIILLKTLCRGCVSSQFLS